MKYVKLMIIILIIVLVFCAIWMGKIKLQNKIKENSYNKRKHEIYMQEKEEMIKPRGMFQLNEKYEGDNDLSDFFREIKKISNQNIDEYGLQSSDEEIRAIIDTDSFKDNGTFLAFDMKLVYGADDKEFNYEIRLLNAYSTKRFVTVIDKTE